MTFERVKPWLLAAAMTALYALAIVLCFWKVLGPDVVFVAPDAPIAPLPLAEAWRQFLQVPTLQGLVTLLPYRFAYEGTFWVDGYVMCLAAVFLLRGRKIFLSRGSLNTTNLSQTNSVAKLTTIISRVTSVPFQPAASMALPPNTETGMNAQ